MHETLDDIALIVNIMMGLCCLGFEIRLDLTFHSMLEYNFLPNELFQIWIIHGHYHVWAKHFVND